MNIKSTNELNLANLINQLNQLETLELVQMRSNNEEIINLKNLKTFNFENSCIKLVMNTPELINFKMFFNKFQYYFEYYLPIFNYPESIKRLEVEALRVGFIDNFINLECVLVKHIWHIREFLYGNEILSQLSLI